MWNYVARAKFWTATGSYLHRAIKPKSPKFYFYNTLLT